MKSPISLLLLMFVIFTGLITSCDKRRAKKLSGTYACEVNYHYWDMSSGPADTSYHEDIYIEQDGKKVIVLGTSIHIDSLWKEKKYSEADGHKYLDVMFKDDRVHITKSHAGLGGGYSRNYEGVKK
jgi:hypothetical protein